MILDLSDSIWFPVIRAPVSLLNMELRRWAEVCILIILCRLPQSRTPCTLLPLHSDQRPIRPVDDGIVGSFHRVKDLHITQGPNISDQSSSTRIERGLVEHHLIAINRQDSCIEFLEVCIIPEELLRQRLGPRVGSSLARKRFAGP